MLHRFTNEDKERFGIPDLLVQEDSAGKLCQHRHDFEGARADLARLLGHDSGQLLWVVSIWKKPICFFSQGFDWSEGGITVVRSKKDQATSSIRR